MKKTAWDIAIVVTIPADSYDEALREAGLLAEGLGNSEELRVEAVQSYDDDYEGQRVLYLHNEEEPLRIPGE